MSRMSLMIGAPVFRREWIIEQWFDHVRAAVERTGGNMDLTFAFAGDTRDPTFDFIRQQPETVYVTSTREATMTQRERFWDHEGYHKMVNLRNQLLTIPRTIEPTFFLSLDTDILLHDECILNLIETADFYDAVGGKCYMTPHGKHCPSWGTLGPDGQIMRSESDGVFETDIIMAIKLMTPNAYRTDYKFHKQGEDIGWSQNVRKQGMKIGWDGRVASKHVLSEKMLDVKDLRVGF